MKKKLTKINFSATIICIGIFFITINSQAEIYKWTDTKGVIHYSSQRPIQQKIKSEDIEDKIKSAAGKSRLVSPKSSYSNPKNTTIKINSEKKEIKLKGPSEKLIAFCKNQRKNLNLLKQNYRNKWQEKDGKTSWLNQEQRKEKVNNIKESITKECAGI